MDYFGELQVYFDTRGYVLTCFYLYLQSQGYIHKWNSIYNLLIPTLNIQFQIRQSVNILFLYVSLYPINDKIAKPIGPKFFEGPHMTPGKVYECSGVKKIVSKKIIFVKLWKSTKKYNENFFVITSYCMKGNAHSRATICSVNRRWARNALKNWCHYFQFCFLINSSCVLNQLVFTFFQFLFLETHICDLNIGSYFRGHQFKTIT